MKTKYHLTLEEYEELQEENCGKCINCGEIQFGGCEPDARKYKCECCGTNGVYGLEEWLIMGLVK